MRWCSHIGRLRKVGAPGLRKSFSTSSKPDVLVLGGGHNGLVAATLLARQGLQVRRHDTCSGSIMAWLRSDCSQVQVLEAKDTVGGACKTEYPFKNAPGLGTSTG